MRQVRVVSLLGSCCNGDDDMKAWHFSRVLSRVSEGESVGERRKSKSGSIRPAQRRWPKVGQIPARLWHRYHKSFPKRCISEMSSFWNDKRLDVVFLTRVQASRRHLAKVIANFKFYVCTRCHSRRAELQQPAWRRSTLANQSPAKPIAQSSSSSIQISRNPNTTSLARQISRDSQAVAPEMHFIIFPEKIISRAAINIICAMGREMAQQIE